MNVFDLSGVWRCTTSEGFSLVHLPGTLDENNVGHADLIAAPWHPDENCNDALAGADVIATRFTRQFTYEGKAVFSRTIDWTPDKNKRIFLEAERSRLLKLCVNGHTVQPIQQPCLSAPYVFEVTDQLTGHDEIELTCDNSYPGWPREDIVFSSAATDETQTNWNGVIGYLHLREEESVFISAVRVYPRGSVLDICIEISADQLWHSDIAIHSEALAAPVLSSIHGAAGLSPIWFHALPLADNVRRWDENEGNLYSLCVELGEQTKSITFGVRDFTSRNGVFTLNGRRIFLRCEANCAVFPETGHWPMDVPAWRDILSVYKRYGVNCMRFHSHCPPEAAFYAADELGMMMQPELSHWNPRTAFSSPESQAYYRAELTGILFTLANHPSFIALTFGNELHMGEGGQAFADELLDYAHETDSTRLYASGSNNHYGAKGENPKDDFYTSFRYLKHDLRATGSPMVGWLNEHYPDLRTDYSPAISAIRKNCNQPVVSFEVGQYEVLPDFTELHDFRGVTRPDNLALIQRKVEAAGLLPRWSAYIEATGELSLLCYRAEVEAALRTEGMSGISLLGLQDFPGQGTALVGMLNSHLQPKPYSFAEPERFARFFTGVLPLALLSRITYTNTETLTCHLRMANYGKTDLHGAPKWSLTGEGISLCGKLPEIVSPCGDLTDMGTLRIPLHGIQKPAKLALSISLCGYENEYSIWVYPDTQPVCPVDIHECKALDHAAMATLASGGTVYLSPDSTEDMLPNSIKGQFSTDFWSVGTFPAQPGGMGQLIDAAHPLFSSFPTETHTDWQWWPMACQRAVILPESIKTLRPIVTLMDSYAYLRPMAQLFECRCHGGRLMFSSLGLHNLTGYPEARALQSAIYRYLSASAQEPQVEITLEELKSMVKDVTICEPV